MALRCADDGYEWYGTIVESGELNSATLPTWHMFASGNDVGSFERAKGPSHTVKGSPRDKSDTFP